MADADFRTVERKPCLSEDEFLHAVQRILPHHERGRHAVVCFHIVQFRYLNERFGFENADKVLHGVARILSSEIGVSELCAHRTADRFLLLLSYGTKPELENRLGKIAETIRGSIEFYGIHYRMEIGMGVCECGGAPADLRGLINRATIAQKAGPPEKGKCWRFYSNSLCRQLLTAKNMEDRLLPAMENGEFVVYYQPKFDMRTLRPCGCEALVRWQTQPDTLIPPGDFIPEFEKSGSIAELDLYIFRCACKAVRRRRDAGLNLPVSVNLSRAHIGRRNLAEEYLAAAADSGVPSSLLELEITESAAAENPAQALSAVRELHRAGFPIAIDDFGMGYSSLGILKDIPADTVKLDRSFLCGMTENARTRKVVAHTVALLKSLGMQVVAEGVETDRQFEILKEFGCDATQGFLFCRPIPEPDFEALLAKSFVRE